MAHLGGLTIPGPGISLGAIWYESGALAGKTDVMLTSTGTGATEVDLFRPTGNPIAIFVGAALGLNLGVMGGQGEWEY